MHFSCSLAEVAQKHYTFEELLCPVGPALDALSSFLEEQVASFEPEVQPLVRYTFGHSGKKLRPLLVFSAGMDGPGAFQAPMIQAAAIVELVHLATLVHDDILDQAALRHRNETIVARHGAHVAVLLGDALFAHALHLASRFPTVEVCRAVSLATRQVCSGEIAQTFARGSTIPRLHDYYRFIDLKTAELFSVSAWLGAFLADLPQSQQQAVAAFARHLGIAYQIFDDMADFLAEETKAGKTLGTDLETGKWTLPVLLWLESLSATERSSQSQRLVERQIPPVEIRALLKQEAVLRQRIQTAFAAELEAALAELRQLPDGWRCQQLSALAGFLQQSWNNLLVSISS